MERQKKAKAIERLRNVLDQIPELKQIQRDLSEFKKWHRDTQVTITHTFGDKSSHIKDFNNIRYHLRAFAGNTPEHRFQEAYVRGLEAAASVLESMIDEIEEYWEEDEQSPNSSNSTVNLRKDTNKVFVIHGHDEAARETVARFLERLNLEPIILHEQPNKGRTIIEKFEDYAIVGFAVVLLTPDDVGGVVGKTDDLNPRARQNVILELGYFIGKLGRERVCPLVKGDLEKPSDYDGVVYTKLDEADGWKMKLVRELKAAGFDIDANRAVGP